MIRIYQFRFEYPVLLVRSIERAKKKNVGRGVSLNIDLQDISELDRDVVITVCCKEEREKIVYVETCITCSPTLSCNKNSQFPHSISFCAAYIH